MMSTKIRLKYIRQILPQGSYGWMFLMIAFLTGGYAVYQLFSHDITDGWSYGTYQDFLYNYGGGFVRRGLTGELLIFLQQSLGIPPLFVISLSSLGAYCFLACVLLRRFHLQGYSPIVLITCFCLGGAFVYHFNIMRRDYIELALTALVLLLYNKMSLGVWIIIGNLIIIFGILLHEATAFFTIPIFILISRSSGLDFCKSILAWLPAILTFLLCSSFKGDYQTLVAVTNRAQSCFPEAFIDFSNPYLLSFMAKNMIEVFMTHVLINFLENNPFTALHIPIPAWCVTLFFFAYIPYLTITALLVFSRRPISRGEISTLLSIIIFQFLCLTPMFTLLSCDLSRVSGYWILSSLLVWLIVPEDKTASMFACLQRITDKITGRLFFKWRPGKLLLSVMIIFIGVPAVFRSIFYVNYNSLFHTVLEDVQLLIELIN